MTRPRFLAALVVGFAALTAPADASIGPYTGVGTGLLDRYRHIDNHQPDPDHIVTDSKDVYQGRFTYSFSIDAFGNITGTGNGTYQPATWRLSGVNGSQGAFSCEIPMRTTPFTVRVTGQTADGEMHVRFALEGAREANDETLCGANYYGFATDDTRLANSLQLVQPPDGLPVKQAEPAIAPLRKLENLGDDFDRRVNLHEWSLTIAAPPRSPVEDPDSSVGTSTDPRRAGRRGRICTIEGTARTDRLRGTPGNDVICGYGGGDRINGGGGHDLIYGGPGNDRIKGGAGLDVLYGNAGRDSLDARDRARDRLDGGRGRDSARVDRGRDRVRRVERVR
jgi:Ca2+-binding RTX toxin-like protein